MLVFSCWFSCIAYFLVGFVDFCLLNGCCFGALVALRVVVGCFCWFD